MMDMDVPTEHRPEPQDMTDRQLLEELVRNSRKVESLVTQFFGDLKSGKINPMQLITGMFKG